MAFDRHMNIVLGDCEEFRKMHHNKGLDTLEERRVLGLTILRGEEVISLTVEGPPPADTVRTKLQSAPIGPGSGRATDRNISVAPTSQVLPGLTGSVKGLGGPSSSSMQ